MKSIADAGLHQSQLWGRQRSYLCLHCDLLDDLELPQEFEQPAHSFELSERGARRVLRNCP